jgi:hypothetical protein
LPEPPATRDSATRPVSVIVSTVVVRSGTPIDRTIALRTQASDREQPSLCSYSGWETGSVSVAAADIGVGGSSRNSTVGTKNRFPVTAVEKSSIRS